MNASVGECQHCGAKPIVHASSEDMVYYQTVRGTIQGLDSLRIATVVAGLTFNFALLTAAGFVWGNQTKPALQPIADLAAIVFALIAGTLNFPFLKKMRMFNAFMCTGVKLARSLEERLILKDEHKLTKLFEESDPTAGRGGDFVFKVSLVVMSVVSFVAACFFIWRLIEDFGKG